MTITKPINVDKVTSSTYNTLTHYVSKSKAHIADLMVKTGDMEGASEALQFCNEMQAALDGVFYAD